MANNPFVRALSLSYFEAFASSQGLNPREMLRRASLPTELLQRQDGILSYRRLSLLLELCERESKNPLFGLQFGLYQGVSIFGPLFYLIHNARSVGEALLELRQNYSLQNGAAEVGLEISGDLAILSYHLRESDMVGLAQSDELAVGIGIQLLRTLVGQHWQPGAVLMRHAPLSSPESYRKLLGQLPSFEANSPGLLFDAKVLEQPLASADHALHSVMARHVERMDRLGNEELPHYVGLLLRTLLPSGRVTIEKVADCMAFTPRTLQRRLADEGTSFQHLLDSTRQAMATQYLEDTSISIAQMAGLLGYGDLTAFCRAFQRWFDMSPREWKRQNHTGPQLRMLRVRPRLTHPRPSL